MRFLTYLALTLCIVLLFSKTNCEDTLANDYNDGEEEEFDQASLLHYVTETYLQDENKIWTEKEAFKPMLEFIVGTTVEEYVQTAKQHRVSLKNKEESEVDPSVFHETHMAKLYLSSRFEGKQTMTNSELHRIFDKDVFEQWYESLPEDEKEKLNSFEPSEEYLYDEDL